VPAWRCERLDRLSWLQVSAAHGSKQVRALVEATTPSRWSRTASSLRVCTPGAFKAASCSGVSSKGAGQDRRCSVKAHWGCYYVHFPLVDHPIPERIFQVRHDDIALAQLLQNS
jgi:hypothetical protein